MNYKFLLGAVMIVVFAGCSSAYRASQMPDDVYFSPGRASAAKVATKQDKYENYLSPEDDQYLRMKVANRSRWSSLDDYSYWNDSRYVPSYSYGYYASNWNSPYAWNNLYNPYSSSISLGGFNSFGYYSPNSFYNPYTYGSYNYGYYPHSNYTNVYSNQGYVNPLRSNTNRPQLSGYTNRNYNNRNISTSERQGLGSTIRRVFTQSDAINNNSRNSNNTYRAPERTYTPAPSSSGSSSRSSSSGSSSGVSRPTRSH